MASIYKRGKVYWGRVTYEGTLYRQSLETTSKTVAQKRLINWVNDLKGNNWGEKKQYKFDDAAVKFAEEYLPTLKPQSARRYHASLNNLSNHFEGVFLHDINHASMFKFEQARLKEGVSKGTVRRDLSCLSSMFSFVEELEWVDKNPVPPFMRKRAKKGLKEAPPRTRYLLHEEERRLIAASQKVNNFERKEHLMLAAAIIFAIDTGLRQEEQLSLTWSDIDLDRERITIRSEKAKNGIARVVPIPPRTTKILKKLPRHITSPYVFYYGLDGKRYRTLYRRLQEAAEIADIKDLRWHDLRRTCGCRLIQDRDFKLEKIQRILGHQSIKTTERIYAFLEIQNLQDAIEESNKKMHKNGHSAGWIE